jgi:ribosomal-protein-serine acetyltransferase
VGITVSPGVNLKLLLSEDSDTLFALTEANRSRLREWLPWLDHVRRQADSASFIETAAARHAASEDLMFGFSVEGRLAGVVGTHAIDWSNRKTTLGYWIGSEFEGKGLIVESCAELLQVLFNHLELNRVGINCATGIQ